jgi:ferredoxin-nitrite reductase
MNKFEQIKTDCDGLDVWPAIERYAQEGWQTITDDDKVRLKWYGIFFRKYTPGLFMQRIRLPGGTISSEQLRTIASIAADFGQGEVDLTTRQQIQVRSFTIERVPAIFRRLAGVGLNSLQTGMDNIRNVMTCPLAGLTSGELLDASPALRAYTDGFVGNRDFSNLPRKFNVTINGCIDNCLHLDTQDIALGPAVKRLGGQSVAGFNVRVGGKQGSGGFRPASPLDVFVPLEQAAELCLAITLLFRDEGLRESRGRARLAFLVEAWGVARFREELERRLGRRLATAGADVQQADHRDHLGLTRQREVGRLSVGLAVPVGRLRAEQAFQIAGLAERYGRGQIRLTPSQNLILTDVAEAGLPALLAEPLLEQLSPFPSAAMRGTVSCTGIGLCDLALTDTKVHALAVARRLEQIPELSRPLTINWSGCPSACGNHFMADIGLQGGKSRVDGQVIEVYQVFAGGQLGANAQPAQPIIAAVPAGQIGEVIERLARAHAAGQDLVEAGQELARELTTETAGNGRSASPPVRLAARDAATPPAAPVR